jgi:diguanylate cyclase (GGDEF)-like protein
MKMNLQKKTSIGSRISRMVAISVLSAMLLLAAILMVTQISNSISTRQKNLEATAFAFAAAMADGVESGNQQDVQKVLRSIARLPELLNATAVDKNHHTIAAMGTTTLLETNTFSTTDNKWNILTKGALPVSVDIIRNGEAIGQLVLIADISDIRSQLKWSLLTTFLASLFAAATAVAFSGPLQKRIAEPISNLTLAIHKARESKSFNPTQIDGAEGEAKVLIDSFNGMMGDIKKRDRALQKLAYFDTLTGLPNRFSFQKSLTTILAKKSKIDAAVYLLDIENFHAINDALGLNIGDALLMNIAALLNEQTLAGYEIARLGGDEFALVIPHTKTRAEAEEKLAPFIAALYQPINILGNTLHISVSVGAIMLPQDATTIGDAQRNLDLAMHAAKKSKLGKVIFYDQKLSEAIKEEAELVNGLRTALQNDALEVHYQPVVNLKSGKVEGFEALARWKHPLLGNISPGKFIPVAEKAGLIAPLGDWVMLSACKTARAWLDADQPLRTIAVNISAAQMLQAGFIDKVRKALKISRLPPELLCLELTESLFVGKSMNIVQSLLVELKAIGVSTALDDFGTGYSSLSYLEHLPFDKLKIDRAFVSGLSKGKKNLDLLQGIIDLAHALDMTVVAEGAEKIDEVEALISLGSDQVQGYYFAKPAPADEALAAANAIDSDLELSRLTA